MSGNYDASAIEVLSGLEPVRKRPGMYTDTSRPNHLVQEVVDNSVDEAIAGPCPPHRGHAARRRLGLQVSDDGRGMPVDMHPEKRHAGVEVILTRLHAGGKFSRQELPILRRPARCRRVGGQCAVEAPGGLGQARRQANTAWPSPAARRPPSSRGRRHGRAAATPAPPCASGRTRRISTRPSSRVPPAQARAARQGGAVPGADRQLHDEASGEQGEWSLRGGAARTYLAEALAGNETATGGAVHRRHDGHHEAVDWAVRLAAGGRRAGDRELRQPDADRRRAAPTSTACAGAARGAAGILRAPQPAAARRQADRRRTSGTACCYVLSVKLADPQFSGQTKERLSSRECAAFVSGVVKDAFSLWLNQHVGDRRAHRRAGHRARPDARLRAGKQGGAQEGHQRTGAAGQAGRLHHPGPRRSELFLVEGDSAGGSAKQARDREFQAVMPLRGKILNTWEVRSAEVLASQEVHDIAVAIGVDPGFERSRRAALRQDLHPGRRRLRRPAYRDAALRAVRAAFRAAGRSRACFRRHAAAVPHRCRQGGVLRAGRCREAGCLGSHRRREA